MSLNYIFLDYFTLHFFTLHFCLFIYGVKKCSEHVHLLIADLETDPRRQNVEHLVQTGGVVEGRSVLCDP